MEKGPVSALNEARAEVRLEFALARAEVAQRQASWAAADLLDGIDRVLTEARESPELFVSAAFRGSDAVEFAERSAVADLAVRLRLSEATVRLLAGRAEALRSLPAIASRLREGDVSVPNAHTAADLAATLPPGSARIAFDDALARAARELAPPRFRQRARRVRDELDPRPTVERHAEARAGRFVAVEHDRDGMSWLTAFLPSVDAVRAMARLDATAAHLRGADGETRTLAQLRSDVLTDLLLTHEGVPAVTTTVAITVPVLTLLDAAEHPATLEGLGPIDPDTARRLAAAAPSFQRILTHPITGSVLDIDRTSYRPPADLRRWLRLRDEHCTFPGCGRRAADCDLDHRQGWAERGRTALDNLAHLCRHHHRLKHEGRWRVAPDPGGGTTWTSPTGEQRTTDPPPF